MNKTLTTALLALLGSAFVTVGNHAPCAPPIPGPGGVAIAIKAFLERQESGASTATLLCDSAHGLEFYFDDAKLEQTESGKEMTAAFLDVDCDGKPFGARTATQFATKIDERIASNEKQARVLTHEIGKIKANCHSGDCSIGVVEFTRVYTVGGGKQMHVPLRATAIMKYELTDGASFRIYHWHASPAK